MKRKSLAGIQKRELNRGQKVPFAITAGFETEQATSCQFIEEEGQFVYPCGKPVVAASSYCAVHKALCQVTSETANRADSSEQLNKARKDFLAQAKMARLLEKDYS